MSTVKRACGGCVLLPILLIASCAGKMSFDDARYKLPGAVLQSSLRPTRALASPMQVAAALDAYVQPRFEILRDKNFGAFRIVYRKHAGIVQLKVDTPQEQEAIANVNNAHRDYIIGLLHCAPIPESSRSVVTPKLQLLYFNQKPLVDASTYYQGPGRQVAADNQFDLEAVQAQAVEAIRQLRAGKEQRAGDDSWAVLMRPVRASTQECLNCHTEAKPGATLGVMVYAVRKSRNDATAKIGMR
jgi:hypothetical protein